VEETGRTALLDQDRAGRRRAWSLLVSIIARTLGSGSRPQPAANRLYCAATFHDDQGPPHPLIDIYHFMVLH
jgi:hypothetical protein